MNHLPLLYRYLLAYFQEFIPSGRLLSFPIPIILVPIIKYQSSGLNCALINRFVSQSINQSPLLSSRRTTNGEFMLTFVQKSWNSHKLSSFHLFSDNINIERYKNVNWQGVDDLIGPNRAAVRVYVTGEALMAPAASLYRRLTVSITVSIVTLARGNVCRLKMIKLMNLEQHVWSRK